MKNQQFIKAGIGALALMFGLSLYTGSAYAATVPQGYTVPGVEITGMNADDAKQAIEDHISSMEKTAVTLDFSADKAKTTLSELGYDWSAKDQIEADIDTYTSGNIIKRYMMSEDLKAEPVVCESGATLDDTKVKSFIEEKCASLTATASDATIVREDGKFVITPGHSGVKVDEEATVKAVLDAVADSDAAGSIEIAASVTEDEPKVTEADLETIQDVLGTYTTSFSSSSGGRATNLKVGSSKINGHLLMPGETLSGYECMQPFTLSNGYKIAGAYENGQVVDSVGGGACQIASTLYNASLRAEIEITQRQNHSMIVSYVPASADAAIAGTTKDIKITNNQETPIYVEAYTEGLELTFNIWGKEVRPANRTVEFESEILSTSPAGVTQQPDPSLPAGHTVKVSSGHSGRKSQLWKIVKVDGVETERTLVSTDTYIRSNSVVRVGTAAAPAPAPVETQPQPAETQPTIVEGVNGGPGVSAPIQ